MRREGTRCLPGLETDSVCVWKGQRLKAKAKNYLKGKYQYFISFLNMYMIYDSDL